MNQWKEDLLKFKSKDLFHSLKDYIEYLHLFVSIFSEIFHDIDVAVSDRTLAEN